MKSMVEISQFSVVISMQFNKCFLTYLCLMKYVGCSIKSKRFISIIYAYFLVCSTGKNKCQYLEVRYSYFRGKFFLFIETGKFYTFCHQFLVIFVVQKVRSLYKKFKKNFQIIVDKHMIRSTPFSLFIRDEGLKYFFLFPWTGYKNAS